MYTQQALGEFYLGLPSIGQKSIGTFDLSVSTAIAYQEKSLGSYKIYSGKSAIAVGVFEYRHFSGTRNRKRIVYHSMGNVRTRKVLKYVSTARTKVRRKTSIEYHSLLVDFAPVLITSTNIRLIL